MSNRDIAIIDPDARIASINRAGTTWSVSCLVFPDPCKRINGFGNRTQGIAGAEKHLRWHAWGKPVCERCGKPVGQKHQKRCRPGTCEVTRG